MSKIVAPRWEWCVLIVAAWCFIIPRGFAVTSAPGPWKLHFGRYGAAVVTDGSALYVIAGADSSRPLGSIEKVDIQTGMATILSARVFPRRFHSAVLLGRMIYVFGGDSEEGNLTSVELVNLDTMKVINVSTMPTPRRAVSAVAIEDLIFTLGGSAESGSAADSRTQAMHVYDYGKNIWLRAPPMPEPKEAPAILYDHHLYVLGGYAGGDHATTSCQRYVLSTGAWETLSPTPFSLSGYSAVSTSQAIICFGDYVESGRVSAYLPGTGEWRVLDVPFTPRRNSAACVVGGQVFVVGGNGKRLALNLIERFSVAELEASISRVKR